MKVSRRRFLKAGAWTTLAALQPTLATTTDKQLLRAIPSSGEQLPVMGLGSARTFNVQLDDQEMRQLSPVLQRFVELGGTMVDTSPMYGEAERVIGVMAEQLKVSPRLFYATKVWTSGKDAGMRQMEQSFELLKTPVIDLLQVHNLVDTATQIENIRTLQEQGRVRYLGITHYTTSAFSELAGWIRREKIDYVQVPYSIANRAAEDELLNVAGEFGVAVIAHRNFERGSLFRSVRGRALPEWCREFDCRSWGNFFLKYLLADERVTNLIPATTKVKHLQDNMNAGLGRLPDPAQRKKMLALVESL